MTAPAGTTAGHLGPAALLPRLLPAEVIVDERWGSGDEQTLHPDEAALVANAVPARRREFAAGRCCARTILAALGCPPEPLLTGPAREPQWPSGIVGSITHCDGYAAAVAVRAATVRTVGVDAEVDAELPADVAELVVTRREQRHLRVLRRQDPATPWGRILFSAKESVFKAWFPLRRQWLDFGDADVVIGADGTFAATLLVDDPAPLPRSVLGRWARSGGVLATAVVIRG
ncbi:MAG: 4'-phosphopantetheinyl transferase family protein, partial [Dermatophilaceae bacterium]